MSPEIIRQLKKIKELLDEGILSQDEFNREKTKILSNDNSFSQGRTGPEETKTGQTLASDNRFTAQGDNSFAPPSKPIKASFDLAAGECVLAKVKCTIGVYPSVNGFLFLTNLRLVVKTVPLFLHPLGFLINSDFLYCSTRVDIPLSSIVSVEKTSLKCKISDNLKSFVVFKILAMSSGFDDAIDKMVSLIKHQFGRDVLI